MQRGRISILEICSGTGIGGIALASVLQKMNMDVSLTVTDIREDALKIAKKWGREVLGIDIDAVKVDATEIYKIGGKHDIVLMFGHSAPHFSPWEMVRLMASVSSVLNDEGVFIMEEGDRIYSISYQSGYQKVLPEKIDERGVVLSLHSDYNLIKGTFRRSFVRIPDGKIVTVDMYLWNLAELMTLA